MKDFENIDVICPVYNHASYIAQCLTSILAQEKVNVTIHVIDDASTDNTLEIAKKFQMNFPQQVIVYSNQSNIGNAVNSIQSNPINLKSQFWTYIEGDDFLVNAKKFISQINKLKQDTSLIGTATQTTLWNTKTDEKQIIKPDLNRWNFPDLVIKRSQFAMYVHISSIVWKSETRRNEPSVFPRSFTDSDLSKSEVLLVHLLLKESRKYLEFQDIEGSCYRYTGEGVWSKLNEDSQKALNEKLIEEIDSITPSRIKLVRKLKQFKALCL